MARGMDATQKISEEFARHVASGRTDQFQPSTEASATLSRLARGLETKRQAGELTRYESDQLREIDALWERIAKYNQQTKTGPLPPRRPREFEPPPPLIIPQISAAEADKIIAGLNRQFEEKVMKKIERPLPPPLEDEAQGAAEEAKAPIGDSRSGRSLQDFLVNVRSERPAIPFADEDSNIDLSRLAKKHG